MRSVRHASIAALADPLKLFVTLKPKKLKNAILTTLPTVDTCSDRHKLLTFCCMHTCMLFRECSIFEEENNMI